LPPSLLYALTGAAVANLQNTALMFGIVLLVAGLFWLVGVVFSHKEAQKAQNES
jgi:high-affinity Fe2+/Pb2+ permease